MPNMNEKKSIKADELEALLEKTRRETMEEELLEKLPKEIVNDGQSYMLFIYKNELPRVGKLWNIEYAKGRYFCDKDKGCADDEYCLLYGYGGTTLKEAAQKVLARLSMLENLKNELNK